MRVVVPGIEAPPPRPLDRGGQRRPPYRIVFVCTGNICRSPMAEVITRVLASSADLTDGQSLGPHLELSSAGLGSWHRGEPMDERAEYALDRAGYPRDPHSARQITAAELAITDLAVALDRSHRSALNKLGMPEERLVLLRAFDPTGGAGLDVPDPYYGDADGFDRCRDMIASACAGLVALLTTRWDSLWTDR